MNNLKYGALIFGLLGALGAFLPFVVLSGESLTFFGLRTLPGGPVQVFPTLAGFVVPLVIAAIAIARPPMLRWQAIVCGAGFGYVIFKLRDGFTKLITDGAIGAKLMAISALAGLVIAILCVAKPETAK